MSTSELYARLQAAHLTARKVKDEITSSAIGGLVDATQKLAKSGKDASSREITDVTVQLAARKEFAELTETLESFQQAGRDADAGHIQAKLDILKEYLPEELDFDELRAAIREIADGNEMISKNPKAGMGIVIGQLKQRYGTRFDSKSMSPIVKDVLGA